MIKTRDSPDPTAPTLPTGWNATLAKVHSKLAFWFFLPSTILTTTIKHTFGLYPAWRPLQTSILMQVVRLFCWAEYVLHLPQPHVAEWTIPKALTPLGAESRKGMKVERVILEPVDEQVIVGVGRVGGVKAVERPGWMIEPEERVAQSEGEGGVLRLAEKGEKVVLYLHAGAYLFGHPLESGFAWDTSRSLNLRVFGVNYRKTLSPETAHPGPLLDALAAYLYLFHNLHFLPENIILIGDSAGGHLSLMLTRYLHFLGLELPRTMALCSPWCDFTSNSTRRNFKSLKDNWESDWVPHLGDLSVPSGMRHYTMNTRWSCWFSPALASVQEWEYLKEAGVKVYIMRGSKEMLRDEIKAVEWRMRGAGVSVFSREDVDGSHIGPTMRWKGSSAWKVWIKNLKELVETGEVSLNV